MEDILSWSKNSVNWLFLVAGTESDIACQCANVRVVDTKFDRRAIQSE